MKKIAFAAIAAAVSLAAVAPVAAQDVTQVAVRYGDLDFSSPAATQIFGNRLEAGADAVCGRPNIRDLKAVAASQECRDAVVTAGMQQLAGKGIQVQLAQLD